MAETVECVRPNCKETFDPDQTGGSCPNCQTPAPDWNENKTGETDKPEKPKIECPDPECSGTIDEGVNFCTTCGADRTETFDDPPSGEPLTCLNGHEVDEDDQFCSTCGEQIPQGRSSSPSGPSVTFEIGSQTFDVVQDGNITVNDGEKSPDVFGTDARLAAKQEGVDSATARQIHRDYLSFRIDGNDCYVTNEGKNPTEYNGNAFPQDEERLLSNGDSIILGNGAATVQVRVNN